MSTCRVSPELFTLFRVYESTASASTYPTLERLDSMTFSRPYALVGFHLCTSFVNTVGSALLNVSLLVGQNEPRITLSNSIRAVAQQFFGGVNIGTKETFMNMGNTGVLIPPGTPVALYGFTRANSITTRINTVCALYLAPVE